MRAEVERAELAEAVIDLRHAVTQFSWLKFLVPGFAGLRSGIGGGSGIAGLLKQYPLLSSLVSMLLAKPLRKTVFSVAKPLVKWGGLAFTGWEAFRVWQQVKRQNSGGADSAR